MASGTSAPPTISTRDFLAANIYLDGQTIFERCLHAFITHTMRAKYPPTPAQEKARRAFLREQAADAKEARDLPGLLAAAEQTKEQASDAFNADKSNATTRAALIDARKKFSTLRIRLQKMPKKHETRRRQRHKNYTHPEWVEKCRAVLGKNMLWCATEFRQWDMYILAEILMAYLPDIFAPAIGSGRFDFEAKELLERLQQVSYGRTLRAHLQQPKEIEVLTALGTMRGVLTLCGLDKGAAKLSAVLAKAQDLYEQAEVTVHGGGGGSGATPAGGVTHVDKALPIHRFCLLVLYVAVCDFEARLRQLVGEFSFQGGSIAILAARGGAGWSDAWRQRVRELKPRFRVIGKARNALFHNNEDTLQDMDMALLLTDMGAVLQGLQGAPKQNIGGSTAPPPMAPNASWIHPATFQQGLNSVTPDGKVPVRILLTLSTGGMSIPIPPDGNFVGRQRELAEIEQAVLQSGARVLVHGGPGIGKDLTVAEALRRPCIQNLSGVTMQAWLHGSTDAALRRGLIECFQVQRRQVLSGLGADPKACLQAIQRWLHAHGGWLFIVEDGTAQCEALRECFPSRLGHGRVVVTSKERLDLTRAGKGESLLLHLYV